MQRRQFNQSLGGGLALLVLAVHQQALALSLSDLSDKDATAGLKTALEKGALAAVGLLGKTDGFLGNPKVRIPLPGMLQDAAKLLQATGQGRKVDELITAMNRGAEAAVPMAKDLLVRTVKALTPDDALKIVRGGDNAVTEFFVGKTRTPLGEQFLPIVTRATEKLSLADKFNSVAGQAAKLGLIKGEDSNIQRYVTGKALDGLYLMIGEEERRIRADPVGTGSAILRKVFGG